MDPFSGGGGGSTRRYAPPDERFTRVLPGELAAITCYFNPCGYRSLRRNYLRFAKALKRQGVPLYTIELAFDDQPFFLAESEHVVRHRSTHVLWHKERLLNVLLPHVPCRFDKIAWVDADILFFNDQWAQEAARLLEFYPVVQVFEEAVWLSREGRIELRKPSAARAAADGAKFPQSFSKAHSGFAWAARRELLARHGLFDSNIVGGGDSVMVLGMFGGWERCFPQLCNFQQQSFIAHWAAPFFGDVRGQVGWVPGTAMHLWHGNRTNRNYVQRNQWLIHHRFDPRNDIRKSVGGVWEWTGENPRLSRVIRQYFLDRREDG